MSAVKALQEKLEAEATEYRQIRKEMGKSVQARTQFMQQLQENQMVKKELDVLEEDAAVYKLIGPMLIKQDLVEAKANIAKRLEYIGDEMKRQQTALKSLENRDKEKQEEIIKLQTKIQGLVAKQQQQQ